MSLTRRVVVTGLGLISPFGVGTFHNWRQLTAGHTATTKLIGEAFAQIPCKISASIPFGKNENQLDLSSHFSPSELRNLSPATSYALVAAKEAFTDSTLDPTNSDDLQNIGVAVGTGMIDLEEVLRAGTALEKRYSSISPYFIPKILANMPAGQISMAYGFQGPNHSVSTACATGCHAIGDAFRMVKYGSADAMICGSTEASISPLGLAGFCRLRALATKFNDFPESASRPFDELRDGFVMGEGAGILVIEELEHAKKRGAKVYGEILGYGMSGDAHHITAPRTDGTGAFRAMKQALTEANIDPKIVGYINAHATSTPIGDEIEINAIKYLFGGHAYNLSVSSCKGAIGHLLGAAGSVEAIFTILACHSGFLPPTANLEKPSPGLDLDLVPKVGKAWIQDGPLRIALCNSFGFGGTNASLCVSSYS